MGTSIKLKIYSWLYAKRNGSELEDSTSDRICFNSTPVVYFSIHYIFQHFFAGSENGECMKDQIEQEQEQ